MAIQTITGTPASGMQLDMFSDQPKQYPGFDPLTKLQYREFLLQQIGGYQHHRHGSPYQRHVSRFEHDRAAHLIHQLGGLAAAW